MEVSWPGEYGEIHTKILERMKRVLVEDTMYPYLKPNSQKRLDIARTLIKNTHVSDKDFVSLGGFTKCMFPWLGTKSFRTLVRYLKKNADKFSISNIEYDGCNYITFKMTESDPAVWLGRLADKVRYEGVNRMSLVESGEIPVFDKYDDCIPVELLRRAYATDRLREDEFTDRVMSWEREG
jgi:ATP-dependent Lhr-like helicase